MPRRRKFAVAEQENEAPSEAAKPVKQKAKEKPAKKFKKEPDWMKGDCLNVVNLILSVQKSDCNSLKVITELTKLYKKIGHEDFMVVLIRMINIFLIREESDQSAPRVLKFIGTFVASFGEEVASDGGSHPLIQQVFKETLSITSKQYYVRARICAFVTNIMNSFSQKAELDETIMDNVIHRIINMFIRDISPVVREKAILTLQRLQDPDNPEDQVTRAYVFHMETDPIAKVRMAAITAIAKKVPVIPHLIDRLSDNDEKVRRHTYLQMSSFPVKAYKIVDRIKFLSAGLNDRADSVRKVISNVLLPNWIATYEQNYADFIKAIKLDSNDAELCKFRELAQEALGIVFKKQKINDLVSFLDLSSNHEFSNCLPFDKSDSLEWLIIWKLVIKQHQAFVDGKRNNDQCLENDDECSDEEHNESVSNILLMPELSVFCNFMEKFLDEFNVSPNMEEKYQLLSFNHCVITLLEIAQLNDFSDEIGCNRMKELMKKLLLKFDVSDIAIKEIAHVMEQLIPDFNLRLTFFNEIVCEMTNIGTSSEHNSKLIIDDLLQKVDKDTEVKANSLKMRMMEFEEQEKTLVEQKNYAEAQNIAEKNRELHEQLIELLRPFASSSQNLTENLPAFLIPKAVSTKDVLKNLRICFFAIDSKGIKSLTQEVLKIYNNFVCYHLESKDVLVRIWALKTATAYSMRYEILAKDVYVSLKTQLFRSTNIAIWETTLQCLVDLLLRYTIEKLERHVTDNTESSINVTNQNRSKRGGRTLYTDDEGETDEVDIVNNVDIVQMFLHVLENNMDAKVHKAAIIGLCKLIIHGQYCSRDIMSKFLLMYFNPATDSEINQILGQFFETIIVRKKQESLQEALIPTLKTLLEAPYDSPLREVKHETVIRYVIGATRPIYCSNGLNLHNTLGLKLLELMKDNPDNKEIQKVFSKELLTLEFGDDPLLKKDMVILIEHLLQHTTVDARTKKNITDFRDILEGTFKPALKFSSTALTTIDDGNEDGEEDEQTEDEIQEEPAAVELIAADELMDCSVSDVNIKNVHINLTKMRMSTIARATESPVADISTHVEDLTLQNSLVESSFVADSSVQNTPKTAKKVAPNKERNAGSARSLRSRLRTAAKSQDESSQENDLASQNEDVGGLKVVADSHDEIPAIQEEILATQEEIPATQEEFPYSQIEIPATQDEPVESEEEIPSSQVAPTSQDEIASSSLEILSWEDEEIPATQDDNVPASQEESGVEEIPATDEDSDEVEEVSVTKQDSPSRKRTLSAKLELDQSLSTRSPFRKNPRNTATPKPASPVTQKKATPAPSTPKTQQSKTTEAGTPHTDRLTRRQAREEQAQSVTLTRSASRKMNVDPDEIAEKCVASSSQNSKEKPIKSNQAKQTGKATKRAFVPAQTKTSLIRAAASGKARTAEKPDEKKSEQTTGVRVTRHQAAATGRDNDAKQRPRWN